MAKRQQYKVIRKFIATTTAQRTHGDDVDYDSQTKTEQPGWAIVLDGLEYSEKRASLRYSDETHQTVVGVTIKEFERI